MPVHHDDDLPTVEAADLTSVTGGAGAGLDLASMLPIFLMKRRAAEQAAPAAAAAATPAWTPKVVINGVEQQGASSPTGTTFTAPA